ncbi:MAG: AIDA repeat-containing protein [Desulfovibrionaceae bacterium]|nr:AIDA repeat-containing protein [Desulfovibrionaceae bacterium]
MATQIVNTGTVTGTILSANTSQSVYDAGKTKKVIIRRGGAQLISAGGETTSSIVSLGGRQVVSDGIASKTIINNGGSQIVSGGESTETTINKGGLQKIFAGSIDKTIIKNGGKQILSQNEDTNAGSTANETTVSKGGIQEVSDACTADETKLLGGTQFLKTGATATNTTVNNGASQVVSAGATATNTTINNGGKLVVVGKDTDANGGISNLTVNAKGSICSQMAGKTSTLFTVNAGGSITTGIIYTPNGGGSLIISANADATNVVVSNNATMWVTKDGTATGTIVNKGGSQIVSAFEDSTTYGTSGGSTIETVVNASGVQIVGEYGTATTTTIKKGGTQVVSANGTATNTVVESGGIQQVNAGTANNTTVKKGGLQEIFAGSGNNTILSGGSQFIYDTCTDPITGTQVSKGGLQVTHNAKIDTINVLSGGKLALISDASADDTSRNLTNIDISGGGTFAIYKTDNSYIFNETTNSLSGLKKANLYTVSKGGEISKASFTQKGTMVVSDSGATTLVQIASGGIQSVSGGTTTSTIILNGGIQDVSGGTVTNTIIKKGGIQRLSASGDGTVVEAGGSLVFAADVKATNLIVSSGGLIYSGDTPLITFNKGGILSGVDYDPTDNEYPRQLIIGANAEAQKYTWSGTQLVNKGTVTSATLTGYTSGDTTIPYEMYVTAGKVDKTTINAKGSMTVNMALESGDVTSTTIKSGGNLSVSGGTLETINVAKGGTFNLTTGADISASNINIAASGDVKLDSTKVFTVKGKISNATYSGDANTNTFKIGKGAIGSNFLTNTFLNVSSGGKIIKATLQDGSTLNVGSKGVVSTLTASGAATIVVSGGGIISNLTLQDTAKVTINTSGLVSGLTRAAGTVALSGGTIAGAYTIDEDDEISGAGCWTDAKNTLTLGASGGITLSDLSLTLNGATLNLAGKTTLTSLDGKVTNTTGFDLSASGISGDNIATTNTTVTLLTTTDNTQLKSKFTIKVDELQDLGKYQLTSGGLTLAGSYVIKAGKTSVSASIDKKVAKNGVSYKLSGDGTLSLTPYASTNKIFQGTAKKSNISGTVDSDIFYGSRQLKVSSANTVSTNDTIDGKNGRDIVVYDTNTWGNDIIKATKGTMNLVFVGLAEDTDYKKETSGTTVKFTRLVSGDADTSQTITVQRWNNDTHIKYDNVTADDFSDYVSASPIKTFANARDELWKETKMLA